MTQGNSKQFILVTLLVPKSGISFGYMKRGVDDEGVIIKPITFIKDGILENFYFDLLRAAQSNGYTSTGSGFRGSLSSLPEPSLLNLVVASGKKTLKEINPATSNPDFIVLDGIDKSIFDNNLKWIQKFQSTSFFGKVDIHKIVGIMSIKTSARPDRRYQQLYEANLVKYPGY